MSWVAGIRAHAASKQPPRRKARPVVLTTWAQTRAPNEVTGDPGAVVPVHYIVDDGTVRLTTEAGKPLSEKQSYALAAGDSAVRIAKMLSTIGREREIRAPVMDVSWAI